jgi:hypothetical protein
MSKQTLLSKIVDFYYEEVFIKPEGFDEAVIGVESETLVLVYSVKKCIQILVDKGYDYLTAVDYVEYELKEMDFGSRTPLFIEDHFDIDDESNEL